jgi:hypothetical protein
MVRRVRTPKFCYEMGALRYITLYLQIRHLGNLAVFFPGQAGVIDRKTYTPVTFADHEIGMSWHPTSNHI